MRSLLAPQAAERGLELRFDGDFASPLHAPGGNPTRLQQVLVNLVGNGLKFTPRGGVTVTIGRRKAGDGRERFRFDVRDTGDRHPGGAAAEPVHGLHPDGCLDGPALWRQRAGLAISKMLVEAMGGEIGVESRPDMGSLFWFEVPLERGSPPPAQAASRVPEAGPPRRVLLVEDVDLNRLLSPISSAPSAMRSRPPRTARRPWLWPRGSGSTWC